MTCVIGLVDRGRVWMGCDSLTAGGWGQWDVLTLKCDKVFVVGPLLIGTCGSSRMNQLLRFKLDPVVFDRVAMSADLWKWAVADFAEECRRVFSAGGISRVVDGLETGGVFMFGCHGRLFMMHNNFDVLESHRPFAAIGMPEYAMGSPATTEGGKLSAKKRILLALKVTASMTAGVRAPFVVKSV